MTKAKLRFRAYFWLMDICLFFAAFGLVDWIIDPYDPGNAPGWYDILAVLVLFFNGLVPLFLMVAKFMRDDYAEGLWRRSLVILAYGVAIVPPILVIAPWVLYWSFSPFDISLPASYLAFEDFFYDQDFKAYVVIGKTWLTFMLLFVGIFQFLRWRDSR
ncbi:hypothetical protein [Erythrobacter crassostreae]|uniref:Uncharacterized protein n=1 Tax=Erythrobacter crassostreae TaxID=2828328 RepID=A0A9X1F483_9SPHN|nr:hypothetical protein [Erythrobacter crassostrea]MBV7259950.1 hypothetical protein [Erythrobacter crassostrea]